MTEEQKEPKEISYEEMMKMRQVWTDVDVKLLKERVKELEEEVKEWRSRYEQLSEMMDQVREGI